MHNIFEETYGGSLVIRYETRPNSVQVTAVSNYKCQGISFAFASVTDFFKQLFLPQGYPDSVSNDYISYQIWDTVQAFCSTVTGTLSTHAIMKGVGVGDETASPLAATVTWVLKDGTGHVGRILFAWWKGTDLDSNSKKWRLFADILNDFAMGLEMLLLPYFPHFSTQFLCLSTAMKAIVGVAGGATRAALTQHHAIRGNLADVSAKDGSQETCVNLLASLLALLVLYTVGTDKLTAWIWFTLFTSIHLLANYYAVKCLRLNSLNTSRFLIILRTYFKYKEIPTIEDANKEESVFFKEFVNERNICGFKISLGCSLKHIFENVSTKTVKSVLETYQHEPFCIFASEDKMKCINVAITKNHKTEDVLRAYWHANILGIILSLKSNNQNILMDKEDQLIKNIILQEVALNKVDLYRIHKICNEMWPQFKNSLKETGWNIENHLLNLDEWRAQWNY